MMRTYKISALLFAFIILVSGTAFGEKQYVEGEVLVKYKKGLAQRKIQEHIARIGATRLRSFRALDIDHLRLARGQSVKSALAAMKGDPDIEHAEPNYKVKKSQASPNDPVFSNQWGLHNIGQPIVGESAVPFTGTADADIDAPEAWAVHNGTGSVIVAVIDTGVDYNHEDLSLNIWHNEGETNCADGLDNDGNGFADDCNGWNFTSGDYIGSRPANDPMDDDCDGHGTHISGIAGAEGNNGKGISGINWRIKIMPIKALTGPAPTCASSGGGELDDVLAAIDYAVRNGANVINASYTYPQACELLEFGPSLIERDAIKNAGDAGIIFVAAAGNFGCDNDVFPFYPASHDLPNLISVGASDASDNLTSFSNFGQNTVHVAAPGEEIYSTTTTIGGGYRFMSGTSMSAPFVSGVTALLKSYKPSLGHIAVRETVLSSTDAKTSFASTVSGGRLNAHNALLFYLGSSAPFRPTHLNAASSGTLTWVDNSSIETSYRVERKTGGGSFSEIASLGADTTSYTDTPSEGATCYRVRAGNAVGLSAYSNESCITLIYAPSGLTATAVSGSAIALGWTDNSSIEEGYEIERAIPDGQFTLIATAGAGTNSFEDGGLSSGGTYYYRVRAIAMGTKSDYSNQASAVTESVGGGGGGGCFIATAAYGSYLAPEVRVLREFRDRRLLTNPAGRLLVKLYYRHSPPLASYIAKHDDLRRASRVALAPVVYGVKYFKAMIIPLSLIVVIGVGYFRRRTQMRCGDKSGGFTLLEVMVVVFILGLLAAIVAPRLIGRTEDAKITEAKVQIRNFETAVKLFQLDNGFYPGTEQGLKSLIAAPTVGQQVPNYREGGYLEQNKIPLDPWGNPYIYVSPGLNGDFDIMSLGADGAEGGDGKNADIRNWDM